jgi:aminopeptidase YwaD
LTYIRSEEELGKNDLHLAGKIALVSIQRVDALRYLDYRNLCGQIIRKVGEAGAIGLIISNTGGIMRTHSLPPEEPDIIPVVSIAGKDGEKLITDIAKHKQLQVRLILNAKRGKVESSNVIARLTGHKSIHQKVILSAHMDTAIGSPGANDNASGIAALLEIARVLTKLQRRRTIEFIAFGAEEPHPYCLGSRHYVKQNISILGKTIAALNLDGLGGSAEYGDMPSMKTSYASALYTGEEIECSSWLTEYITKIASDNGLEIVPVKAVSMSDNVPFALEGISATHFRWMKDIYSHSAQDTIANMELNKVIYMAKLAGLAVWELSNDLILNPNKE